MRKTSKLLPDPHDLYTYVRIPRFPAPVAGRFSRHENGYLTFLKMRVYQGVIVDHSQQGMGFLLISLPAGHCPGIINVQLNLRIKYTLGTI